MLVGRPALTLRLPKQGGATPNMFHLSKLASIKKLVPAAATAVALATAVAVPASAITQSGPLYVHDATSQFAIEGYESGAGNGVNAVSGTGYGVYAVTNSTNKAAVYAIATNSGGIGITARGNTTGTYSIGITGVEGVTSNAAGFGVAGVGSGAGASAVVGISDGGMALRGAAGGSTGIGAYLETDGSATPLLVHSDTHAGYIARIDPYGDLNLAGHLTQNMTSAIVIRGSGAPHVSYGAQTAQPAIEDSGEGRIVGGAGFVAIDAALAATLDPRSEYHVFLQPEGDSRGLYVTAKTLRGFYVRESMGGRSTLAFSYRILGRPVSATQQRLPIYIEEPVRVPNRLVTPKLR